MKQKGEDRNIYFWNRNIVFLIILPTVSLIQHKLIFYYLLHSHQEIHFQCSVTSDILYFLPLIATFPSGKLYQSHL